MYIFYHKDSSKNLENLIFSEQNHEFMNKKEETKLLTLEIFEQMKIVQNFDHQHVYQNNQYYQNFNNATEINKDFIISDKKTKHYQLLEQKNELNYNKQHENKEQTNRVNQQITDSASTPHKRRQQMNKTVEINKKPIIKQKQSQFQQGQQQHTTKKQIKNTSTKTIKIHKSKFIEIQKQLLQKLINQNNKLRGTIDKLSEITKKLQKKEQSNKTKYEHQKTKIEKLLNEVSLRNGKIKEKERVIEELRFNIEQLNVTIEGLERYKVGSQNQRKKQLKIEKLIINELIQSKYKNFINQTPHKANIFTHQIPQPSQLNNLKSSVQQLRILSNSKKQSINIEQSHINKRCYQCDKYFQQIRQLKLRLISNSTQSLQTQILRLQNLQSQHLKTISQQSSKIFKLQAQKNGFEQVLGRIQREKQELQQFKNSFNQNQLREIEQRLLIQLDQKKEDNKLLEEKLFGVKQQCERLYTAKQEMEQRFSALIPELENQISYYKQNYQHFQRQLQDTKKQLINQKILRNQNENVLRDNISMVEQVNKELVDKCNHVIVELAKTKQMNGQIQAVNKEMKRQHAYLSENIEKMKEENEELLRNLKNLEIMKNKQIQLLKQEIKEAKNNRNRVYSVTTNNQSQQRFNGQNMPFQEENNLREPQNLGSQLQKVNISSFDTNLTLINLRSSSPQEIMSLLQTLQQKLIEFQQVNKRLKSQNLHLQQALTILQEHQHSSRLLSHKTLSIDNMSTNKHIKLLSDEMFSKKDIYDSTGYVMEGRSHRRINSKDDSSMGHISSQDNLSKQNSSAQKADKKQHIQSQQYSHQNQQQRTSLDASNNHTAQYQKSDKSCLPYTQIQTLLQQTQRQLLDQKSKRIQLQGQLQGIKRIQQQKQQQIYLLQNKLKLSKQQVSSYQNQNKHLALLVEKYQEQIVYLCQQKEQLTACMMRITTQIYEINNQDGSSIGQDNNLLHNNNIDSIDLSPTLNKGKTLLMSLKRISNSSKQIITSMRNIGGGKSSKDVYVRGNDNDNEVSKQQVMNQNSIMLEQQVAKKPHTINDIQSMKRNMQIQRRQRQIQHELFVQTVNLVQKQILSSKSLQSQTSLKRIEQNQQEYQAAIQSEDSLINVNNINNENENVITMKQSQLIQKITSSAVSRRNLSLSGQQYHYSLVGMKIDHESKFNHQNSEHVQQRMIENDSKKSNQSDVTDTIGLYEKNRQMARRIEELEEIIGKLEKQKKDMFWQLMELSLMKRNRRQQQKRDNEQIEPEIQYQALDAIKQEINSLNIQINQFKGILLEQNEQQTNQQQTLQQIFKREGLQSSSQYQRININNIYQVNIPEQNNHNSHNSQNNQPQQTFSQENFDQSPYIKLIQQLQSQLYSIKSQLTKSAYLVDENAELKQQVQKLNKKIQELNSKTSLNKKQKQNLQDGLNIIDQVSQGESSRIHMTESKYQNYQSDRKSNNNDNKGDFTQNQNQLVASSNSSNKNSNKNRRNSQNFTYVSYNLNDPYELTKNVNQGPRQRQGVYFCNQNDTSLDEVNERKRREESLDMRNKIQQQESQKYISVLEPSSVDQNKYHSRGHQQRQLQQPDFVVQNDALSASHQLQSLNKIIFTISSIPSIMSQIVNYIENYEESQHPQLQNKEKIIQQMIFEIKAKLQMSKQNVIIGDQNAQSRIISKSVKLEESKNSNFDGNCSQILQNSVHKNNNLTNSVSSSKAPTKKSNQSFKPFIHLLISLQSLFQCIRFRLKLLKKLESQKYLKLQNQEQEINHLTNEIDKKDQMILSLREKVNTVMKQNKENQLKYLDQMRKIMESSENQKIKRLQMDNKVQDLEQEIRQYRLKNVKLQQQVQKVRIQRKSISQQNQIFVSAQSPIKPPKGQLSPTRSNKQIQMNEQIQILRQQNHELHIRVQESQYEIHRMKNDLSLRSQMKSDQKNINSFKLSRSNSESIALYNLKNTSIQKLQDHILTEGNQTSVNLQFLRQILTQVQQLQQNTRIIQSQMQKNKQSLILLSSKTHNQKSQNSPSNTSPQNTINPSQSYIKDIKTLQQKIQQNDKIMKQYKQNFTKQYVKLMNEILMMQNNESISKDKFKRYIRKLQETVIAQKVEDQKVDKMEEEKNQEKLKISQFNKKEYREVETQTQNQLLGQIGQIKKQQYSKQKNVLFKDIINEIQNIVSLKQKHQQDLLQKLTLNTDESEPKQNNLHSHQQNKYSQQQTQSLRSQQQSQISSSQADESYIDLKTIMNQSWLISGSNISYDYERDVTNQIEQEQEEQDSDQTNNKNESSLEKYVNNVRSENQVGENYEVVEEIRIDPNISIEQVGNDDITTQYNNQQVKQNSMVN